MRRDRSDVEFEPWEIVLMVAEVIGVLAFAGVLFGALIKLALL